MYADVKYGLLGDTQTMTYNRYLFPLLLFSSFGGCGESITPRQRTIDTVEKNSKLLAIFQPFDLFDFELDRQDSLTSLGGRWISLRFRRKEGLGVSRTDLLRRLEKSLDLNGWEKPDSGPSTSPYVVSEIFETDSERDVLFTRGPFPSERSSVFYNLHVYISDDASVVCLYCEVGW